MTKTSLVTVRENGAGHLAVRAVWVLAVAAFVLYIPTRASIGTIGDMALAFELIIAAMALNLVFGYTGQISLGHSAFFGIGAYTTAILIKDYGWSPGWTFYAGVTIAFVVGCLAGLPAVRLQGVYLALVTLSLAVLFPALVRWQKLAWLTEGARGIDTVRYDELPEWPLLGELGGREGRAVFAYWLAFVLLVIAYLACRGIVKSRVGRALVAIRDNGTAAAVMGVNVTRSKMLIFGLSAAICSLAGSLSTLRSTTVTPDTTYLTLFGAIVFLLITILGGAGTLWGPIIGGILYVWIDATTRDAGAKTEGVIPTLFGWIEGSPAQLILAAALLLVTFVAPHGAVGLLKGVASRVVSIAPAPLPVAPAAETLVSTPAAEEVEEFEAS
jgi:branched-chain amino acid transport system permease protein